MATAIVVRITNPEVLDTAARRYHLVRCECRGEMTCQAKEKAEAA